MDTDFVGTLDLPGGGSSLMYVVAGFPQKTSDKTSWIIMVLVPINEQLAEPTVLHDGSAARAPSMVQCPGSRSVESTTEATLQKLNKSLARHAAPGDAMLVDGWSMLGEPGLVPNRGG